LFYGFSNTGCRKILWDTCVKTFYIVRDENIAIIDFYVFQIILRLITIFQFLWSLVCNRE